jgi:hypothetical protein
VAQAIGVAVEIFGAGAAVALAAALLTALGGWRIVRSGDGSNFILPCAVIVGFIAGYFALPRSFAPLTPQANQPWQWLPYFAVITGLSSASLSPFSRPGAWALPLVVSACIAAAVLAPSWPVFGLTRRPLQLVAALYLVMVGGPLLYLPGRIRTQWHVTALAITGAINAIAIGATVSTRLAELAAIGAAGFAAAAIAGFWFLKATDRSIRSLTALFAILTGGTAWLAFVEPDPPQPLLMIAPLLPLLLWVTVVRRVPFAGGKIG